MNNNMEAGFMPGYRPNPIFPNFNFIQDIRNLENRVSNLEREVNRLRNRVNRLESNHPMPRVDETSYTNTYQSQGYNMM